MYSDYTRYLNGLRNSLIQCGVSIPDAISSSIDDYYATFLTSLRIEDILFFYRLLAIADSSSKLDGFIIPLDVTYKEVVRKQAYKDFIEYVLPAYKVLVGDDSDSIGTDVVDLYSMVFEGIFDDIDEDSDSDDMLEGGGTNVDKDFSEVKDIDEVIFSEDEVSEQVSGNMFLNFLSQSNPSSSSSNSGENDQEIDDSENLEEDSVLVDELDEYFSDRDSMDYFDDSDEEEDSEYPSDEEDSDDVEDFDDSWGMDEDEEDSEYPSDDEDEYSNSDDDFNWNEPEEEGAYGESDDGESTYDDEEGEYGLEEPEEEGEYGYDEPEEEGSYGDDFDFDEPEEEGEYGDDEPEEEGFYGDDEPEEEGEYGDDEFDFDDEPEEEGSYGDDEPEEEGSYGDDDFDFDDEGEYGSDDEDEIISNEPQQTVSPASQSEPIPEEKDLGTVLQDGTNAVINKALAGIRKHIFRPN